MAVGAIGSAGTPSIQKSSSGGENVAQLQQKKEMLQKQLDKVKSKTKNSQAEQDAAVKQIKQFEQQIAEIDQKIQNLSQTRQQGQNAEVSAVSSNEAALAQNNSQLSGVQNKQSVSQNMQQDETQKNAWDDKSKATDQLLDTYA